MRPVGGASSEVNRESYGGIGGDAPFSMDYLIDASWRDFYYAREFVLAEVLWLQILLHQYFSGVLARHGWNITLNVI